MRGAWIEIGPVEGGGEKVRSLPMRGAWIEIPHYQPEVMLCHVAPHAGSVD